MFLLTGVARYLFVPMAEAVVFAMLASYVLSRTLIPTMAKYLLKAHAEEGSHAPSKNPLVRFQAWFEYHFERIRSADRGLLEACVRHGRIFAGVFLAACVLSFGVYPWVGQELLPPVGECELPLRLSAPTRC